MDDHQSPTRIHTPHAILARAIKESAERLGLWQEDVGSGVTSGTYHTWALRGDYGRRTGKRWFDAPSQPELFGMTHVEFNNLRLLIYAVLEDK